MKICKHNRRFEYWVVLLMLSASSFSCNLTTTPLPMKDLLREIDKSEYNSKLSEINLFIYFLQQTPFKRAHRRFYKVKNGAKKRQELSFCLVNSINLYQAGLTSVMFVFLYPKICRPMGFTEQLYIYIKKYKW